MGNAEGCGAVEGAEGEDTKGGDEGGSGYGTRRQTSCSAGPNPCRKTSSRSESTKAHENQKASTPVRRKS